MSENGETQIRFKSADYPQLEKTSISVPLSCTTAQLKSLVEGLIETKLGSRADNTFSFKFWYNFYTFIKSFVCIALSRYGSRNFFRSPAD